MRDAPLGASRIFTNELKISTKKRLHHVEENKPQQIDKSAAILYNKANK